MPVVLLIGMLLGACALAIGVESLDRAQRIEERQRAIDSFNSLVETAQLISAGGVGAIKIVELDVGSYSILADGKNLRLLYGGDIVQEEILPLRVLSDLAEIKSGSYFVELGRIASGDYILRIRSVSIG